MEIHYTPIQDLKPYDNNPKLHPPEQILAIANSIKNFGFDQPIVVDSNYFIIKGHGRWLAAKHLNMKQVPVIISSLNETLAVANRILDNRTTTKEYNIKLLKRDLNSLEIAGMLSKTLFTETSIPLEKTSLIKGEISLFSLKTNHKCPQCTYRW